MGQLHRGSQTESERVGADQEYNILVGMYIVAILSTQIIQHLSTGSCVFAIRFTRLCKLTTPFFSSHKPLLYPAKSHSFSIGSSKPSVKSVLSRPSPNPFTHHDLQHRLGRTNVSITRTLYWLHCCQGGRRFRHWSCLYSWVDGHRWCPVGRIQNQ